MPRLLLGPVLRHVGEHDATVWMETDGPCDVEVLGHRSRTFCVEGHHYALLAISGLQPGETYEYGVALDGREAWSPPEGWPRSVIRTLDPARGVRLSFGSCRVSVPHEEPWTCTKDKDPRGREVDALHALAHRLRERPHGEWPDLLLMLGDQVYADEDAPATREEIRRRRDTSRPPGDEVANFEEYTLLYHEAWGEPTLRWLLSTVPSAMLFDDHDVHDDWNTSRSWLDEITAQPWWHERIVGALMSYWLYQHLGNLPPTDLEADELLGQVRECDDAGPLLRRYAADWDRHRESSRWSYARRMGGVKLVVLDSREGRMLDDRDRRMVSDAEWEWIVRESTGDFDHLVLADTLPVLMPPTFHEIEAWNEAVCAGAWGRLGRRIAGERLRRALDLEHWAAFRQSFEAMAGLVADVASGRRGRPPATVVLLAGDIHHAYHAEARGPWPAGATRVHQAVCSPFRNPLNRHERVVARIGAWRPAARLARLLARSAGVPPAPLRWRLSQSPTFDNQVATLELRGREATLRIERTVPGGTDTRPRLEATLERRLV